MSLTPDEIADKEFLVGLRGYDKDEVRSFLQTVSVTLREAEEATAAPAAPARAESTAPPSAEPKSGATGAASAGDFANLGEEIAVVLRTAHEQAAQLRADADADAAKLRADADADAAQLRAEAEQQRDEAGQHLTSAQEQALGVVADAQARVDKMTEAAKVKAEEDAQASVAHLRGQTETLGVAREQSRQQLNELRSRIDHALASTEADQPA